MASKCLLDTDIGVDDALALILAIRSPELEITDIVAVHGNIEAKQAVSNISTTLAYSGAKGNPRLFLGSSSPLAGSRINAENVHGADGLGGVTTGLTPKFAAKSSLAVCDKGVERIREILSDSEAATLIFLGPLTNLAKALQELHPIKDLSIFILGGSIHGLGNITPFAEFNFYCDPEAAQQVFASGLDIYLVPLEVCRKYVLSRSFINNHALANPSLVNRFIREIHQVYMDYYKRAEGIDGCFPHDSMAVAAAVKSEIFSWRPASVSICITGELRGQSNIAFCDSSTTKVAYDVDVSAFEDLILTRIFAAS